MVQEYGFYLGGRRANSREWKRFEIIDTDMGERLVTFPRGQEEYDDCPSKPKSLPANGRVNPGPRIRIHPFPWVSAPSLTPLQG